MPINHSRTTGNAANLRLWVIFLGSPIIWAVQLQTDYALVPWVCTHSKVWLLRSVASAFLVPPLLIIFAAWRGWRKPPERDDPSFGEMVRDRGRFMSLVGLMTASLFFLVILIDAAATFIFDPCAY